MSCHGHDHKVNETRKRSLVKAISFRIIEIVVDIVLLYSLMQTDLPELIIAGLGAVAVEASCGIGYYLWERLWNMIDWGREVKIVKREKKRKN